MKFLVNFIFVFIFQTTALADDQIIHLGAMLHLTGEFAIQGEAFRQGAELARDTINASGGINGQKVEIIFEDTQYKPLVSNTVAKRLAADKKILGNIISTLTETKASANVLEKNKLPSIVLWDSSPELDKTGDFIFSIGPWAPASGEKSAEHAVNTIKAKTAVVVSVQTEWSVYVGNYFESKFKELGGKVLHKFEIDPNVRDFRTVLLKAKAANADVIYAPVDSNIMAFFKQVKEYNIKIPIITSDILDKELFDAGGDIFEGIYQSQSANPEFPATKQMIEAYIKKYSKDPDYLMYTSWAYDGIMILAEAVKTNGTDRVKVRDGLYSIKDFDGASGKITFNKDGSAPREVKIYIVKNQKLIPAV